MSSDEDIDDIFVPSKKRRVQCVYDMCRHKKWWPGVRLWGCCRKAAKMSKVQGMSLRRRAGSTTGAHRAAAAQGKGLCRAQHCRRKFHHYGGPCGTHNSLHEHPPPAPHEDDLAHLELTQAMSDISLHQHHEGSPGKSSGAMLVKAAIELREGYEEKQMPWTSRRMHHWTFNPAENRHPHVGPYVFPESDLLSALNALYFDQMNLYYALLHRPIFESSIASRLHTRDASFGVVVLFVCAIASRFSDDMRVCPPGAEPLRLGWQYVDQLPHVIDHLFVRPALHHIQYFCLAVPFLEYVTPSACWTWIRMGIRMAQDVGAHRARNPGQQPTVESELWKSAFWLLVCLDRQICTVLGHPCTTQYEDFDAELLIGCDDEFWVNADPVRAFTQPVGKPSPIRSEQNEGPSRGARPYVGGARRCGAGLSAERLGRFDTVHLRWDPNRPDDIFFDQSALLYGTYYQLQMTIHRPFIPTISKSAATELTNDVRQPPAFVSAMVLLLNVWSRKHTGLPPPVNTACNEVHKMMACIKFCETRLSRTSGVQVANFGLLLVHPNSAFPKFTPAPSGNNSEDDQAQHPQVGVKLAAHPPYGHDAYLPAAPAPTTPQIAAQFAALPKYTADLGWLPVFHQYAEGSNSGSSWYHPRRRGPP
ncbi:fungal-specific transcription factor domain-containing protein [Mycena epipterygia]|nr:fungal-specific transcription factor domain-containing protein [Mycena epipterygia]